MEIQTPNKDKEDIFARQQKHGKKHVQQNHAPQGSQ